MNGPVFQNFMGYLDGNGRAEALLSIIGPVDPIHVGRTVTFAFTLWSPFDLVSNPVFMVIAP
jgi:hypothetical protein